MELIIVESPTKARTLSKFLGDKYQVEATMGHIKDLPKSKLSVDVEHNFAPNYEVVEKKNATIKTISKIAKKASHIYLATDPDREGEAISQHAQEILNEKLKIPVSKMSRIVFHEITDEAVKEALAHPRAVDKHLVDAQIARRVLDRLVGYTLSPLLWKKVRRGLSAGRVQSVAVRLIVEREREIEKFKAVEYWEIYCEVAKEGKGQTKFAVQLVKIDGKKIELDNKSDAGKVVTALENSNYRVLDIKKREVKKSPYPPFTTSTLTQAAANTRGWSAKKTMSVAQNLYELGLITYHRTDSVNIAKSALSQAASYIKKTYGEQYLPDTPRVYKTKAKVAQEAHEAVRPTKVDVSPDGEIPVSGKFAGDAKKLYELIWRRYVASQISDSRYDETKVDVEALEGGTKYLLRTSGQIMRFDGWRKVLPNKMEGANIQEIPELTKEETLSLIKVNSDQKFTQPPARFNEASIIKTLEALGIGRPSTYAPIISTIQARQYVDKDEGKFKPTPVGFAVTEFLLKYFPDIIDYDFTKGMEDDLDEVANGEAKWTKIMGEFWKPYDKKITEVTEKSERVKIETEKLGKKCPTCQEAQLAGDKSRQGELVIRIGRFGKFISCSNFPECKHTEKFQDKVGMKCPKCKEGDVIVKKTGKWRKFFGCSRYPDCDFASWKDPRKDTGESDSEKEEGN